MNQRHRDVLNARQNIPFVIVGHPRSGSNFLAAILNQHPGIFVAGEVFQRKFLPGNDAGYAANLLGGRRLTFESAPLFFRVAAEAEGVERVGVRLFDDRQHTLSDDQVIELCRCPEMRVIILSRMNLLKAFLSRRRARSTGVWGISIDAGNGRNSTGETDAGFGQVPVEEAREWIQRTKQFLGRVREALLNAEKPFLDISYEDLCLRGEAETTGRLRAVFRHLEIDPLTSYEIKTARQVTADFYQTIDNRAELTRELHYSLDES